MKRLFLASVLLISTSSWAAAPNQVATDFRQATMDVYKWYLVPMKKMVKGKIPFDAEKFKASAEGLALATQLNVLAGFPKGSDSEALEDSYARNDIWDNWGDFEKRARSLQRDAAKLAQVAQGGDRAAMKAQFGKTAKNCGGCHKKYRVKK